MVLLNSYKGLQIFLWLKICQTGREPLMSQI